MRTFWHKKFRSVAIICSPWECVCTILQGNMKNIMHKYRKHVYRFSSHKTTSAAKKRKIMQTGPVGFAGPFGRTDPFTVAKTVRWCGDLAREEDGSSRLASCQDFANVTAADYDYNKSPG